ncbi:MAG: hypothetical protein JRH08_03250 [Deltaproteobacteria bacterium]|nr:hypothetical protein [Deltaproteobacteria bacterium]MBW1927940.1 hypothetical protein [Deltaproteobacteria bacterium]MBW2024819.1 hypothetical protein [Deltaproteobacteria bacterium]MBW2124717.1 hypothetical protein [Deltaproteobacteria bacterium]RLB24175.1 MAG: hypothetical protein DRG76_02215 [Deltaproteobacteria bacterium]
MEPIIGKTLTSEVEKRLESLFREEAEEQLEGAPDQKGKDVQPLEDLKSIVLSLEWEITDEVMGKFLSQTEELRKGCKDDKVLSTFIQMLSALGKYIRRHKGGSHPDAVKLLSATFESFEKVFKTAGTPDAERKQILDKSIKEFLKLKKAIMHKPRAKGTKREGQKDMEPGARVVISRELMEQFLNEIKVFIKTEFEEIKAELRSWKEAQERS